MKFKVYMAPITVNGRLTLQADVETWLQVSLHLKRNKLGGVATLIERQLGLDTVDRSRVARLDFVDAQGRSILRACGLSA